MNQTPIPNGGARRLGTFGGVFTPSILTILGVVMYLRFGWVVGCVGLGGALMVVVLSHLISTATGLSVSSIATNRTVGAGGAYYMISRSLGSSVGAAVGLPLFFAQALSVTFYVVGFTESLDVLLKATFGPELPVYLDPRVLGTLTLVLLTVVALKSAETAIKIQYVVMVAIGASLVSFFFGTAESPPTQINWWGVEDGPGFAAVFAVFFPAVTGIMAGVSMSGDLKDPRRSLPRGTMFAILAGFVIYMVFPIWLAMNASAEELFHNKYAVWDIALVPALIYVGVWGATLSSAVGSILAAPRTLQALGIDGLAPKVFAKGHGDSGEPKNGLLFTFALAQVGVLLGSLDLIAPILTMFFLATYGITNLAAAFEGWAANPSFRPTFRVSPWISFSGAIACFYVMSMIDILAMVGALFVCGLIYLVTERRQLSTTFGDARHGFWAALVRTSLHRMHRVKYNPGNWRPNLLIFGGPSTRRRYLLDLGASLVQDRGLVSYVQMIPGNVREEAPNRLEAQEELQRLADGHPNVFFRAEVVPNTYAGVATVAQSYGIGRLEANSVMLGWLNKPERAAGYFQMLGDLHALGRSLLLVRHDPNRGFGQHQRIHVWWGGMQANGGMMLLLAFLLKSDHNWRRAEVICLTVVDDEADRKQAENGLKDVFESARLDATARVLRRDGREIAELMHSESADADLVIMGMRLPDEGAEVGPLFDTYARLLDGLGTVLLVNSGGDFDGAPVLFDD